MYGGNPYGGGAYGGVAQQAPPVPPPPPSVVFRGVLPTQVGGEYDLAIGANMGDGTINMVGYLIEAQTEWNEAPNIQDEQRLVTIASPNTSDRYTSYPKVTQDDWSGGEGQEYFTSTSDPTKYYQSFNVDPTKPGYLAVTFDAVTTTVTPIGASRAPVVCDGSVLVAGLVTGSPYALVDPQGNLYYLNMAGTPEPLFGQLDPIGGAFFATRSGANGGIYRLDNVPKGGVQPTSVLWNADIVEPTATQALAYMSSPAPTGGLYYLRNDNKLVYAGAAGAGTVVYTGLSMEAPLRFLCSTATGLLWATQSTAVERQSEVSSILYSFDGTNTTRIFDFDGIVRAGFEMNGVTYLLLEYTQPSLGSQQFTLMSFANGQLTTIFDQRYASPDFQSVSTNYTGSSYGCSLSGDGRFLYIGWPGYYSLVYDTARAAFMRWGPAPVMTNLIWAHRFYTTSAGVVDVVSVGTGALALIFTTGAAGSTSGYVTSSWIDGGTAGIAKAFRCFELELQQPFPVGATVQVAYRLDQSQPFTTLTNTVPLPNGNLMALLPPGTKGYRIQARLILNAIGATSPVVRSMALTINPARVWKLTLSCRRGQTKRNGQPDTQGDSTELLANLLNIYDQGGFCTIYIPDPRNPAGIANPDGSGVARYVSMTTAKLEDDTWHTNVSAAMRQDVDGGGYSMEGLLEVLLNEQL